MESIVLNVNGHDYTVYIDKKTSLLDVLRNNLDLTGAKRGCNEGYCGACKVIIDGEAVNSCSIQAVKAVGKKILTIEGLSDGMTLHPIQQAFIETGAIQCGYCTSGMIMTAKAFLDKNPTPTRDEIKAALSNNLCRCTGYVKIIRAIQSASEMISH